MYFRAVGIDNVLDLLVLIDCAAVADEEAAGVLFILDEFASFSGFSLCIGPDIRFVHTGKKATTQAVSLSLEMTFPARARKRGFRKQPRSRSTFERLRKESEGQRPIALAVVNVPNSD